MQMKIKSDRKQICIAKLVFMVITTMSVFPSQNVNGQTSVTGANKNSISSVGAMEGVDLQRTRTYQTKAVPKLNGMLWKSEKLFELNYVNNQRYGINDSVEFADVGFSDPIYRDGLIYVGLCLGVRRNFVLVVDGETGKPVWKFESKEPLSSPILANGLVYLTDMTGNIFALNPKTGKEELKLNLKGQEINVGYSPAINSGVLFLTTWKGHILAVDLSTQQTKWIFKASETLSAPAFDKNKQVFIGGVKGFLRAIDIETGKENWNFKIKSEIEDVSVSEEIVYFKSSEGEIYAVSASSGQQKWVRKIGGKTRYLFPVMSVRTGSAFAIHNKTIIFSGTEKNSYYLFALNAEDGVTKWQSKIDEPSRDPIIADGIIYLGTWGIFYAFDFNSGKQLWLLESKRKYEGQTIKNVVSSPFVYDGTLFIITDEGIFYALR
jgi:outer membrane protein assembly factor BamB